MDRRPPRTPPVPNRAAALLNADPRHRVRRAATTCATNGRHGPQPAGPGLAVRQYCKGRDVTGPGSAARARRGGDYDAANPANAAKLAAADALGALADEAGLTLIQMAVAFAHPTSAVASAIIGPRIMEHREKTAISPPTGSSCPAEVLDRIDEIVPPGVTVKVDDNMWNFGTMALDAASRRQRSHLAAPGPGGGFR